jgi:hypothetical protein
MSSLLLLLLPCYCCLSMNDHSINNLYIYINTFLYRDFLLISFFEGY